MLNHLHSDTPIPELSNWWIMAMSNIIFTHTNTHAIDRIRTCHYGSSAPKNRACDHCTNLYQLQKYIYIYERKQRSQY